MKKTQFQTLRSLIREAAFEIKTMNRRAGEEGDVVFSLSGRTDSTPSIQRHDPVEIQRMAKHYLEAYSDEFLKNVRDVMLSGKNENDAIRLVVKNMNQKYGDF